MRQAQASRLCVVAEKLNKDDLDDGRDDNDEEKHRVGREPGKSGFPVVADAPRVEFVEDLAKDKGIEELYYSIKSLSKKYRKKIEFTIIGDKDEDNPNNVTSEILNYFKSDSSYIRYLSNSSDINQYLKQSHILIHPSYHEGLSVICQEAVCIGRGIIASDISGCREIVKNNVNGFLIPFRDQDALYLSIIRLLEDSKLRLDMGKKGREIVINNFRYILSIRYRPAQELVR